MSVGSERGTTHLDALYVDGLFVGGTLTGSVINAGTENITQSVETLQYTAGTVIGTYGNLSHINMLGTLTGTKAVVTNGVFSSLGGSVITGTEINVTALSSSMKTATMVQVTDSAGSFAHGLGVTPSLVSGRRIT